MPAPTPTRSTSVLATLRREGVPATSFLTGNFVRDFPAAARSIAAAGFRIGDHTITHPYLTQLGDAAVQHEIVDGAQQIMSLTGQNPAPLFRFPLQRRRRPSPGDQPTARPGLLIRHPRRAHRLTISQLWSATCMPVMPSATKARIRGSEPVAAMACSPPIESTSMSLIHHIALLLDCTRPVSYTHLTLPTNREV